MASTPHRNSRRKRRQRILISLLVLVVVFLLGPRVSIKDVHANNPVDIPNDPGELDRHLETSERSFAADLVPETQKKIFWHDDKVGQRTRISVVFLHGFSGSHMTLFPLPEQVAEALDANLYCNRYAGHGRKDASGYGTPMAEATPQKWVDDTKEALAIGRRLGDTLVVLANSTAAPIATWLAGEGHAPDVLVMLSPNFGPKNPLAKTLLGPWGRQILWLKEGETYAYDSANIYGPDHVKYASTAYPSSALLTMMAVVELGRTAKFKDIRTPTLCLYSERDKVVSPKATKQFFQRLGNPANRIEEVMSVTHKERHVLGGDLMSPKSTGEVVDQILRFLHDIGTAQ